MPALSASSVGVLTALLLARPAGAVRHVSRAAKDVREVAGVPIINYRYRFMQNTDLGISQDDNVMWIFKLKEGTTDQTVHSFCDSESLNCVASGHPETGVPIVLVRSTLDRLENLLSLYGEMVEYVEPDLPLELELPGMADVEPANTANHHPVIGLTTDTKLTGKGVSIYVMDTGARTTHADFEGRAIPTINSNLLGPVKVCRSWPKDHACVQDENGHGTHVAGTAGGKKWGVAKKATLRIAKVCCGFGGAVLTAIDWVVRNAVRPAVATLSIGESGICEVCRVAVDKLVAAGVTITVSAGNTDIDACTKTYSFIASAISVAASDNKDIRAEFSNWGKCNALFAPGVSIQSASRGGDEDSEPMTGTSHATPSVAGTVALLLERTPTERPFDIEKNLLAWAKRGVLKNLKTNDPNIRLFIPNNV